MNHKKVFLFILPAIGAAILAVLSQLSFAFGTVPVTLQTFAIGLIATIFKPREAFLATVLYLLLGAIGLPVFAGGHGGLQALLGPTGGYLLASPIFALITSALTSKNSSFLTTLVANLLGDAVLFAGGVLGLHFLGGFEFTKAITIGVLPFILADLLKMLLVAFVSQPIFYSLKFHYYFRDKQKNG